MALREVAIDGARKNLCVERRSGLAELSPGQHRAAEPLLEQTLRIIRAGPTETSCDFSNRFGCEFERVLQFFQPRIRENPEDGFVADLPESEIHQRTGNAKVGADVLNADAKAGIGLYERNRLLDEQAGGGFGTCGVACDDLVAAFRDDGADGCRIGTSAHQSFERFGRCASRSRERGSDAGKGRPDVFADEGIVVNAEYGDFGRDLEMGALTCLDDLECAVVIRGKDRSRLVKPT